MNFRLVMFHNDTAMQLDGGGRGRDGGRQREKKEKSIRLAHFFPGMAERGDLLWGNDDLCQGWKGRQGASGTKVCANND